MSDIKKSVMKAFEKTNDFRISYDISEKGASSLISKIYTKKDAEEMKFYRKPELADGDETKLAIIYGEVLITPYIIDMGTTGGTQDPENIKKTIRFIMGDGETEGIVEGPNGSPLENIYIGRDKETPQPVIDSDGRPSTKDVILAAALGGAIKSLPNLWNKFVDDAPEEQKIGEKDPITGDVIKTQKERETEETIGKNLSIGGLSDVTDSKDKGTDYILAWDNCLNQWTPRDINSLLQENSTITGAKGGDGGSGGAGGSGGSGGAGGTGGTNDEYPEPEPIEPPDTDPNKPADTVPSQGTLSGMIALPDISETEDNEYYEQFSGVGTNGIMLHFLINKIAGDINFNPNDTTDPTSDFPCITNPNVAPGPTQTYDQNGQIILDICMSINVCGTEHVFYKSKISDTGYYLNDYTINSGYIQWCNTDLGPLIANAPGQIINDQNLITLRIRRMDNAGSKYPVFYQGMHFIFGEKWYNCDQVTLGDQYPKPAVEATKADDGLFPDRGPRGSIGAPTCPVPPVIPGQPAIPPSPGQPGAPGEEPVEGTPGESGNVEIAPAPAIPILVLETPLSREYCFDDNHNPVATPLPRATKLDGNTSDDNVKLSYDLLGSATGHFEILGDLPDGVVSTFTNAGRSLLLSGPSQAVKEATGQVEYWPTDTSVGEYQYKIVLVNTDPDSPKDGCNGLITKLVPCSLIVENSQPACAFFELKGTSGSVIVYSELPGRGEHPISGEVLFNGTLEQTAIDIAQNINDYISARSTLPLDDEEWLPATMVATADGKVVNVCSPKGPDFNELELRVDNVSGDLDVDAFKSILGFFGGIGKNISDIIKGSSFLSSVSDVFLSIAGNVAGAVLTNFILNRSSSLQISIPADDDDVKIVFLYRGRKVNVPEEYDAENRTGSPNYDNWSGEWKNVWTDNPAWCVLEFIENPKYGLGQDIILTPTQKENLYRDIFAISQYCDERENDQPKFSLNTAITEGTKIQVLEQLCSVFFGAYVFYNGGLRIRADRPDSDIQLLVTQSNAGKFTYEHTTLKSFVNKVEVTYLEPGSFYTQEVVKAENALGIDKYGEKAVQLFGFGITNKDQALRYANWVLNSETDNSLIVTYTGGWDHYRLLPGDIVQFEDSNERAKRFAGRIKSISGNVAKLDGPIDVQAGNLISITQEDGSIFETTVASVVSDKELTLGATPTKTVLPFSTFIIADAITGKQLYRVVKVEENTDGNFNTTLQLYNIDKYYKIQARTRS